MSALIQVDTLDEGGKKMLRMRCRLRGSAANTLLFFIDRKVVRIANCRGRWPWRGYRIKKLRYPFYDIGYLGLRTLVIGDLGSYAGTRPGWVVVLGLTGGGLHYVSLGSQAYNDYNAAVQRVCSLTGIRRFDPKL